MRWMLLVLMVLVWVCGEARGQEQQQQLPEFAAFIPEQSGAIIVADYADPAPAHQFAKPKEGNKFIAVQLILVSATGPVNVPVDVNPTFAEIKCTDMAVRSLALGASPDPKLAMTKITESDDRVMGWVAFEIPVELKAEECKLAYGFMEKTRWIKLSTASNKQAPPPK